MSTTTSLGTRRRITKGSSPFAPGATIAEKQAERWHPIPSAAPGARHLDRPLVWRKPRHGILTNDLFDGSLSDEDIAAVFGVMAACPQHTFQVLTKRPERARKWFEQPGIAERVDLFRHIALAGRIEEFFSKLSAEQVDDLRRQAGAGASGEELGRRFGISSTQARNIVAGRQWAPEYKPEWPLRSVWLGVSVEDQATADERIPLLLQCPAAVRFASYEPALGAVDFGRIDWKYGPNEHVFPPGQLRFIDALSGFVDNGRATRLDWLIVGGESGPGARPCHVDWIRSVRDQCAAANVACFIKQMGRRVFGDSEGFLVDRYILDDGAIEWCPPIIGFDKARFRQDNAGRICGFKPFDRKGGDWSEWPPDLRVREFPGIPLSSGQGDDSRGENG